MENRRDHLKRLLAIYRKHLAEGVTGDLATIYLKAIINAEAELRRLNQDDIGNDKRE